MYPAHTQLLAKWSSPSIGDQRATGCGISVACQTFLTFITFLLVEEVSGTGQKPDPTFVTLLVSDLNCGVRDNFSFGHCRRHMFWNIFP